MVCYQKRVHKVEHLEPGGVPWVSGTPPASRKRLASPSDVAPHPPSCATSVASGRVPRSFPGFFKISPYFLMMIQPIQKGQWRGVCASAQTMSAHRDWAQRPLIHVQRRVSQTFWALATRTRSQKLRPANSNAGQGIVVDRRAAVSS